MIVCVCPSPAVDVTYELAALTPGATNRVDRVGRRAGGKAVNVARILHARGETVRLVAPLGGPGGELMIDELGSAGLDVDVVPSGVPTRNTVTIVDESGRATVLAEPAVIDCWAGLQSRLQAHLDTATAVVVSGSLPDGIPAGGLTALIEAAHRAGLPVVVDTSGAALVEAIAARPTFVKPNAAELRAHTGIDDPLAAAAQLALEHGVGVVASLGPDGVIAVGADDATSFPKAWRARPGTELRGNPTGAGDALVAGLAAGLSRGSALPDLLADAVAFSAAAVLQPHAGVVDDADVDRERAQVVITEITADMPCPS